MIYNELGQTGLRVSRFGLGCMRFPPDEAEAVRMVRYAIDHGVNYLDTAYVYRNSEEITGRALRDGYRDKVVLATKSPLWNIAAHADFEKYLDEELTRLGTDHIDVYLLHNLNPANWEKTRRYDGFAFLDKMIAKGKIRHKAFSLHNTFEAFKEILEAFDWEMAQIQLNILDEHNQAGVRGLRLAAERGVPVVVMEPLRGGFFAGNVPEEVSELVRAFPERRSLVEWCFRWLYDMPEVSVVLSGTSSLVQLQENLTIFEQGMPGVMTEAEKDLIRQIQAIYAEKKSIACTGCEYCLPCPSGVAIPEIFRLYNSYQLVKPNPVDVFMYKNTLMPAGSAADRCAACGECEERCPQGLAATALLPQVHKEFLQAPMSL
ncbi:MAG: aldo/keto reductase [Gracilibacteraceae bacterium]|jgi:predicted aldo/keto reductase-like oxidoreductase|nr:aldo/keto reductase [Gracilibacteraceae bacterium]